MCRKERWEFIAEKVWPEGTSEECKQNPYYCPGVQPEIRNRCLRDFHALDFIYETEYQGLNFRKYNADDKIVQKVQTGKGDASRFSELGEVLYI